uniref:Uncharacterized protein n=1 Tax=Amphimedon queenslandica TaxID=400682 RepID=A0A1X7V5U0_AMPQE
MLKKKIKCVEHLIITSFYALKMHLLSVSIVQKKSPEEVFSVIQDRITCHIPDSKTSPDLNFFVTK